MSSVIHYREATLDDSAAVAELHARSWRAHYRGALTDEYLDGDVFEDRRTVWSQRLSAPSSNQFAVVAVEDTDVVGFACVYGADDPRWGSLLDNLHVSSERHKQGIGTRLMLEAASWCQKHHPDCGVYLWVLGQNAQAQRFYRGLGGEDAESEVRSPNLGGGPPRRVHRYVWSTPNDVVRRDGRAGVQ